MEDKLVPYTQQSLLEELAHYFGAGIRIGRLAKTLLLKAGLDARTTPDIGFNSGQYHHNRGGKNPRATYIDRKSVV